MADVSPKVFISYAWTSDEYTSKVYDFVKRLRSDGIETLFDQFDLKPGNSLHNYMEKCVSDKTVTNVLILLNPEYKKKADERKGGTGIETQIISEEVYNNLDNTKFIPVIFDLDGKQIIDVLPIYLKSRFFVDLSHHDNYEDQYRSLIRNLYGKPAMVKNSIGSKPSWVDDPKSVTYDVDKLNWISNSMATGIEKITYRKSLNILISETEKHIRLFSFENIDIDNFEEAYSSLSPLKNLVIGCVNELIELDKVSNFIEEYFENYSELISPNKSIAKWKYLIFKILAHEIIISIIALLYKYRKYAQIYNLITYSFLARDEWQESVNFHTFFYSQKEREIYNLDVRLGHIKYGNKERYKLTGIGDYWSRNISFDFLTLQEFVNADILISNLNGILLHDRWFAISYVYADGNISWTKDIANAMLKKSSFLRYKPLFGNLDETTLTEALKRDSKYGYHFGYENCFDRIPMISELIDGKKLFDND